jgi:hypothetical protein
MALGLYGPEYLQFSDGGPAAEVRIFVFLRNTKTKAVLYADRNGDYTGPNPVWTDRRGELVFYVEQGLYDLYYEYPDDGTGTTIPIEVTEDAGGNPGVPPILGYVHPQSSSTQNVQIVHNLSFYPAGIIAIDNNGDGLEYDHVAYPAPGIIEIFFKVDFAGTIYLS